MGQRSLYKADPGAVLYVLSRATWPLSVRILSQRLFGGADRCIKGLNQALAGLLAEGRVKVVKVQKNGKFYEHWVLTGEAGMTDYKIEARDKGTELKATIQTDDPQRAIRFAKLLAASGKWDALTVHANRTSYTLETLDQLT